MVHDHEAAESDLLHNALGADVDFESCNRNIKQADF
jgi:hypothetical protein